MNENGDILKTLRKINTKSNIKKNLPIHQQRRCKTHYLSIKRDFSAVPMPRLNHNSRETNHTKLKHRHDASFIIVYWFGPICMPVLSPGKHNSQPSLPLLLPFPILMIHLFADSFPLHSPRFFSARFFDFFLTAKAREDTRRVAQNGEV